MSNVVYHHGVAEEFRDQAAALYDSAFGGKFAVAIPDESKRVALLRESLDLSYVFGAFRDDRLVGIAGYKTSSGSLTSGITYERLINRLGFFGGHRAAIIFSLYERELRAGELLMDGIAVDAAARGEGIGSHLLADLVRFADEEGYEAARLDVIDTNPRARDLYERHGFVATKTEHFGYLRWLLGFGAATTLTRSLRG